MAERRRSLGGEVGEIDAERLAGDRSGRVVGKKVDAADNGVGLEDEIVAGRRHNRRRIVDEPEGARRGGERL